MTDFIYWLGDAFQYSFKILPWLGNHFNLALLLITSALSAYWTLKLVQFRRAGADQE